MTTEGFQETGKPARSWAAASARRSARRPHGAGARERERGTPRSTAGCAWLRIEARQQDDKKGGRAGGPHVRNELFFGLGVGLPPGDEAEAGERTQHQRQCGRDWHGSDRKGTTVGTAKRTHRVAAYPDRVLHAR